MQDVEIIKSFFKEYISEFQGDGGSGTNPNSSSFDLMPRDFLDFAEKDLDSPNSIHSLVNATSNLKRAVDCQLDHFLKLLNLDSFYREKRLGVDRKLGFLDKSGLFRSKSLEKLNKLRNRLEHHYEVPEFEDVEVYYDLVVAFVGVIEGAIPAVGHNSQVGMSLESGGYISTEYKHKEPEIIIELDHKSSGINESFVASISTDSNPAEQLERFAFFFRVHLLLRQFDQGISSEKHVLRSLSR